MDNWNQFRMRDVLVLIVALLLGILTACTRPTEAECDQAFDHYFDVKMKDVHAHIKKIESTEFEERRAEFLSKCVESVEKSVIQCWLDSETLEQIADCQKSQSIL